MKTSLLAVPWAAVLSFSVYAVEPEFDPGIETITVTANAIEHADTEAPYASEVYGAEQISASGSTNLYDFLDKLTSVVVLPSYGNRFSQLIDLRGYGIGSGYQNVQVTLDGRSLNNIDMAPQLLGAIPPQSLERIEIAKGSGSVIHGDGAMAGVINLYTRPQQGVNFEAKAGNHGAWDITGGGGVTSERVDMGFSVQQARQDGFSEPDVTGTRDEAESNSIMIRLAARPLDRLRLDLGLESSDIQTTYPGPLTLAEFRANPAQNGGNSYGVQQYATQSWHGGMEFSPRDDLKLRWEHGQDDKNASTLAPFVWDSDYEYRNDRLTLNLNRGDLALVAGASVFDGMRRSASDETRKANEALFLQADYRLGDNLLSAGMRREWVDYRYAPNAGTPLTDRYALDAWDLGLNHRIDQRFSLFANFNQGFQAPDIDRFFTFDPITWVVVFNGLIEPAESRTLNAGINFLGESDKVKLSAFHSWLRNEIYFDPFNFVNTNIDDSHKYGLELQAQHRFNEQLSGRLNYAYTQAIIDREDSGGGAYDGKDLPGVSPHSLSLGLRWRIDGRSDLNLSHSYRSETFAAEDFANAFSQRHEAYQSTDLSYRHRLRDQIELTASVQNLFAQANGIWVHDDAIYPVNFTRNWLLGVKVDL